VVIAALMMQRPAIQKGGIATEIRRRWPHSSDLDEAARRLVPDAYEFHDDLSMLTIIEVVDTNPIRGVKASRISDLSFALDDVDWALTVAAFNTAGKLLGEVPGAFFRGSASNRDVFPDAQRAFEAFAARAQRKVARAITTSRCRICADLGEMTRRNSYVRRQRTI
jgi:hypothetical protein